MQTISFYQQFLDALLNGEKQQTTRKQTTRIKVGDICHIYIEQHTSIIAIPLRRLTQSGHALRLNWANKDVTHNPNHDHAHFLGKVVATEVYDILPCDMSGEELEAWAWADGFDDFDPAAGWWFMRHYGENWMQQTWTVIRWRGWADRQFEPDGDI